MSDKACNCWHVALTDVFVNGNLRYYTRDIYQKFLHLEHTPTPGRALTLSPSPKICCPDLNIFY